jgi:hypothetical protein
MSTLISWYSVPNAVARAASGILMRGGLLKSGTKSLVFILWYEFLLQFRGYFPASLSAGCLTTRISTLYHSFEQTSLYLSR